jgi:TonB family protein
MKTNQNYGSQGYIRLTRALIGIVTAALLLTSCGKSKSTEQLLSAPPKPPTMTGDDTIWFKVDEMPEFPGGDSALLKHIGENTDYPEIAKRNNVQGKVILRFCVTSTGNVEEVSILKGVDPALDAESIRVISTLPAFKPGKQGGKPVAVWYVVPISFALK